jgi:hypothetical protein
MIAYHFHLGWAQSINPHKTTAKHNIVSYLQTVGHHFGFRNSEYIINAESTNVQWTHDKTNVGTVALSAGPPHWTEHNTP